MLRGIDVSFYQKFDNYEKLNESRMAFVFIKASEDLHKDPSFDVHNNGFSRTCLLKGAYHFHRFKTSAKDQADFFINTVASTFSSMDLPPVLDLEDEDGNLSSGQYENEIQIWLDQVEQALHVKPIIYTGRGFWTDPSKLNNSLKFKDYLLWHAQYAPNYLPLYGGWEKPAFWQYGQGYVIGLSGANAVIDLDDYLGDIGSLWSQTSKGLIQPSLFYNSKVEALQYILNLNGFNAGLKDGIFGTNTLNALHKWQTQSGMANEDTVTPKMWQSLFGLEVVG
jgi:lysozyme